MRRLCYQLILLREDATLLYYWMDGIYVSISIVSRARSTAIDHRGRTRSKAIVLQCLRICCIDVRMDLVFDSELALLPPFPETFLFAKELGNAKSISSVGIVSVFDPNLGQLARIRSVFKQQAKNTATHVVCPFSASFDRLSISPRTSLSRSISIITWNQSLEQIHFFLPLRPAARTSLPSNPLTPARRRCF